MALLPGTFIDAEMRFEVIRLLGQGGMATVYEVRDHKAGDAASSPTKIAALKLASSEPSVRESARRRIIAEFDVIQDIRGSSVVQALHLGTASSGSPFFTMEVAKGEPLASWLENRVNLDPLSVPQIVRLLTQIAKAVKVVHDAGYVFVDLTPSNIFVNEQEGEFEITLIDFGLACKSVPIEASESISASQHGSLVGTKTHISPEQVRGDPLTNRTDIYAFGILAYQICTGELPYQMDNLLALIANQTVSKTPSIRAKNPAIPRSLEVIVQVAMEKSPSDRFSSMDEVIGYLARVQKGGLFGRLARRLGFRSVGSASQSQSA